MSIPSNQDFALEVRTDRLTTLWKVTLGISVVLAWIVFTAAMLERERYLIVLLPPGIVIAGCVLTRELLTRGRFTPAVWAYALSAVAAVAILLYTGSEDLKQIVPFVFPLIVFVVGLLLPP